MPQPVRKAILPVAGLGTRFLPATKAMPKEMLPIVDKPIIQYAVEEARAAGIEEIIFVTGRGKTAIEDHFDHSYELESVLAERGKNRTLAEVRSVLPQEGQFSYTRQQQPLGLGHAVWCARNLVGDEPFAVLLADDLVKAQTPCLKQMVDAHQDVGGNIVAVMDVPQADVSKYGIVDTGASHGNLVEVKGLVEKPDPEVAPSRLAVIGRYILQSSVFKPLGEKRYGTGNEIQLTDAMASRIGSEPFHGYRFAGERFDCGNQLGFLQATVAFGLDRPDLKDRFSDFLKELNL